MLIQELTELEPAQDTKMYANLALCKELANQLAGILPNGTFKVQNAGGVKTIPHVRAQKISLSELQSAMSSLGATASSPDAKQSVLSGKFPVHSFELGNNIVSIVIGSVSAGASNVGLNRKELAPTGLGLDGGKFTREELIINTKKGLDAAIRDQNLKQALIGLVDIAAAGGNTPLDPELAASIKPLIGIISQDFGEILAPILIMDNDDIAEFPSGNAPIVDVKLKNTNLSVKALTGSGTSFKTVADLMDQYESSINSDKGLTKKYQILKQFHPSTGGSNVDKIIRAVSMAKIPEYTTICSIIGVQKLSSYDEFAKLILDFTKNMKYSEFLETFYPAMMAGNWGKPVGLPADGPYYMGQKKEAPKKEKAAGKNSYMAKPGYGAANILTYVMGIGLLNYIRRGKDSKQYSNMMTDIVKQANASIGHITINPNGTMTLKTTPFSQLKFEFQYHAPSHIPGNNLPGFMYVPD
jgi:hypothetical protein